MEDVVSNKVRGKGGGKDVNGINVYKKEDYMSLDWFPKKKEDYKKYEMMCFNLLHISECVYDTSIGECRQKKKEDCSDYKKALMKEETFEQYNEAINECSSALIKMLDKEKILKASWKAIPDIHEEVNEYELRADNGDYSPNEHERMLMEDFAHGLVEEIVDKVTQAFIDYMKGGV